MAFVAIFGATIAKMPYLWVSVWNVVYLYIIQIIFFTYLLFPEFDCAAESLAGQTLTYNNDFVATAQ